MKPLIRRLDPAADLALVVALYDQAADYWLLADREPHGPDKAAAFFTDGPPGSDAALSYRMGIFDGETLAGVAELSFGFPEPSDAYLGLMILSAGFRGKGLGKAFVQHLQDLARGRGARRMYLGVLEENPRGRAFWAREGFQDTGVSRRDLDTGHLMVRLGKDLAAVPSAAGLGRKA